MEIEIICTEIIKPYSPTPDHLRTHKFFYPNRFPTGYTPVIFFYSTKEENPIKVSSHLKNSLSKALTYYYPLAGQNKDGVSTECNDHGVVFIETQVIGGEMTEFIEKKDNDMLKLLVPLKGNLQEILTTYYPSNLVVQVNYFGCGGIAICMCFNHDIMDGSTVAHFHKNWSEVARGANDIKNVVVDCSHVQAPHDTMESLRSVFEQNHSFKPTDIVSKSFTLDSRKISALKERIGSGPYLNHPTRVEAIITLISDTLIKYIANSYKHEFNAAKQISIVIPVNLRDKVNPPLPLQSIGNLLAEVIVKFSINQKIHHNILAAKIHEHITKAVDEYKKNIPASGIFVEDFANSVVFPITDLSKFPYYEADFGWGKPLWFFCVFIVQGAFIQTSSDGEGVELLIGLSKEEMKKFEQDPEILTYTTSSISKRAKL